MSGGLGAAERALSPGGALAVVTFHSIGDRMVKRFMQARSDAGGAGSRHAPASQQRVPQFTQSSRKAISADAAELAANPRSRSARLRVATRTDAAPGVTDRKALGMPLMPGET